jgi:hypothetical protein
VVHCRLPAPCRDLLAGAVEVAFAQRRVQRGEVVAELSEPERHVKRRNVEGEPEQRLEPDEKCVQRDRAATGGTTATSHAMCRAVARRR